MVQFKAAGEPTSRDSKNGDGVRLRNPTWKYKLEARGCIQVQSVLCLRELSGDETGAVISGRVILNGSLVPVELATVHSHSSRRMARGDENPFVRRSELPGEESD